MSMRKSISCASRCSRVRSSKASPRRPGCSLPSVTDERARAQVLDSFSNRVALTVENAGNQGDERSTAGTIYEFHYEDLSRVRALKVVDTLLSTFVEQTLGGKREGSENAQKFLESQIKDYEQRLSLAEDKLANFKKTNLGLMPSDQGGYFAQLQKETDDAKKAEIELSIAVSRREELTKQLHSDQAVSEAAATGPAVGGTNAAGRGYLEPHPADSGEARRAASQVHRSASGRDCHPRDARGAEEAPGGLELESLRRGDAAAVAASGAGNNPVYQSMELELNKVDVEIAALRQELAQHQSTVADLRARLNSAPQVEAEFQQLNRDYDVNKAQYTALLESYQKARLGERADNAGSVRFEIVLPPTAPVVPVWPKRTRLLARDLAAGTGGRRGSRLWAAYLEADRQLGARPPIEITSFPVLGVVSERFPDPRACAGAARISGASPRPPWALLVAFAVVLALNWSGARLTIHAIRSLVKT